MVRSDVLALIQDLHLVLEAGFDGSARGTESADAPEPGARPLTPTELTWLDGVLSRVGSRERASLAAAIARLDADSPLLCPVSLFGPIDYGRLETAHTRALAWLLDPRAEHGFGDALLRAVLDEVGMPARGDTPAMAKSMAERSTADGGRTDVWVEGVWSQGGGSKPLGRWLMVIEAKVDHDEREAQLDDYDREIDRWLEPHERAGVPTDVVRVLLTRDGRAALTGQGWTNLSFGRLGASLWRCGAAMKGAHGFHFLRYYVTCIVRDVLGCRLPLDPDRSDPYAIRPFLAALG